MGEYFRAFFGQMKKSVITKFDAVTSEDCDLFGFGAMVDLLEDQRPI